MSDPDRPESSLDVRALARAVLDAVLVGDRRPVAYAHPLEFVCIPILRTRGFGVCGHIWQDSQSASTVHCHSWHLDSKVVVGAVRNEIFAVIDRPDGDHHLLSVDSTSHLDRMTPTGQIVGVQTKQRTLHQAGSSYSLRAGVFHRSTPMSAGPVLTLLAATMVPGALDQIVATRARQHRATQREELPAAVARTMAALLRSAIDGPHPLTQPGHEPARMPRH